MNLTHIKRPLTYSIAILTILAIAIWWFSSSVVWLGDDIDYQFQMKGAIWQSWGWIHNWNQFWDSQFVHYTHVNGRFVAHTLVQLFCGILGQQIFAVCNALMYVLFAVCIAYAGSVRLSDNWQGMLTAACLSVVCFVTKIMPTCQIGYIWMMAFNLAWLMAFFRPGQPSWIRTATLSIIGIIVGNGQECISIGVCAGLGIWWIIHFIDWRRSWMMLGYFIGTGFCCLSPATLSRVSTVAVTPIDQLIFSAPTLFWLIILVWIAAHIRQEVRIFNENASRPKSRIFYENAFTISAIIFLIIFNLIIGIYSDRQLFGINLFAIILILRILPRHRFAPVPNALLAASVLGLWTVMSIGIREVKGQYDDILTLYSESKDGSVEYDRHRVLFGGIPLHSKYYEDILGQFDNDLHHSIMKQLKHNGGKRTLKLKPSTLPKIGESTEYYPGHFAVTVQIPDSASPNASVTAFGHRTLFGIIHMPVTSQPIEITRYSRIMKPYGIAVIIPENPYFKTDSILICSDRPLQGQK